MNFIFNSSERDAIDNTNERRFFAMKQQYEVFNRNTQEVAEICDSKYNAKKRTAHHNDVAWQKTQEAPYLYRPAREE